MAYFQTHKTLRRSVELKRLTSRNDPKLDLNFDDRWIVKSGAIVKLFIPLLFAFEALQNHHVKKSDKRDKIGFSCCSLYICRRSTDNQAPS